MPLTIIQMEVEEISELSLEELSSISHATPEFIQELVEYGTLDPVGFSPETWRFHSEHLRLIRMAMHLHQDLELNHAGIALTLELINELESLRKQIQFLEKSLLR